MKNVMSKAHENPEISVSVFRWEGLGFVPAAVSRLWSKKVLYPVPSVERVSTSLFEKLWNYILIVDIPYFAPHPATGEYLLCAP